MSVQDTIECPRCGRSIVPRLNVYDESRVTFGRVQHLCPLCGAVAFESGGGVRWGVVAALVVTIVTCLLIVVLGTIYTGR
jgi:hypothetical protein